MKELIRTRKELRKEFQAETNYYNNNKKIIERIKNTVKRQIKGSIGKILQDSEEITNK